MLVAHDIMPTGMDRVFPPVFCPNAVSLKQITEILQQTARRENSVDRSIYFAKELRIYHGDSMTTATRNKVNTGSCERYEIGLFADIS